MLQCRRRPFCLPLLQVVVGVHVRHQQEATSSTVTVTTTAGATVTITKTTILMIQFWTGTTPTQDKIVQTRRQIIEPMKALTSPIFISTDPKTGRRHQSLKYVVDAIATDGDAQKHQEKRPSLFVSNHQLLGFDSFLVVNELLEACNNDNDDIFVRPLTHPFLSTVDEDFTLPGSDFLETYGCLPATPKTFYNCMKHNQTCLLFPGGAKESFHKSGEEYTLKAWSETLDFVRVAAKYNATIIPFSSVGAAESALFLDQIQIPFARNTNTNLAKLGDSILKSIIPTQGIPYNARYDAAKAKAKTSNNDGGGGSRTKNKKEEISFPFVVPKGLIPERHYFLFDTPIDTTTINHKDKIQCRSIYNNIKRTIQQGCYDLVQAKESDPFGNNGGQRLVYERLWKNEQAPTFPIDLLN